MELESASRGRFASPTYSYLNFDLNLTELPDLDVPNSQVEPQIGGRVGVQVVLELDMFETP